jgi:glycyl-tRNA synthetase beta chain
MAEFLLEIGCEEIPARMIATASSELARRVTELLARERLLHAEDGHPGGAALQTYSTPRRLALVAACVAPAQSDCEEQVTGPSVKIAYKDGQPTPAAQAFAKKLNVNIAELQRVSTPKGEYISARVRRKGRSAADILVEALPKEIASLYWPKSMYWRSEGETFVRPLRWLVAMLDGTVLPLAFAGVVAGGSSRGHRLLHQGEVPLAGAQAYSRQMETAWVIADPTERRARIRQSLDGTTRAVPGARWREDAALLDTVVNLTEWPSVVLGGFEPEFLALPPEVLVTVMRDHQKYFAVEGASGELLPYFLAVLNTDADPDGIIRHGHERVLRARFNDAHFFWRADQKVPLKERVALLKSVTFQKDLGSYYDKTLRLQRLASWISETVKQSGMAIRPGVVHKAALLAKADLTTELVKEFTELQGIVGGLYARVQQLDPGLRPDAHELIAQAIYDQYQPASVDDAVPRTVEGAVLAIADKADSIAGMFALGLVPTGSKDPFALRRQANGIVSIVAERQLPLRLSGVMQDARSGFSGSAAEKKFVPAEQYQQAIEGFFRERLEFYLREVRGYAYDVVNAVLAAGCDDVVDAVARAEAVARVREMPDFISIAAAAKRIRNILRQAAEKGLSPAATFADLRGEADEAKALQGQMLGALAQVNAARESNDYGSALLALSTLRPAIDAFFDRVMVMAEDASLRANRLALLQGMLNKFSTIADFSEIVTEKS